ncbi:hypothetical protein [Microlunatus speluncae]|uniref:hypothetical protein n=1 Tax=Microlunatus speluncae TaxID=2594267 RepID=UPI001266166E|nr:hypothetical protein [Microlunatus speluncae]
MTTSSDPITPGHDQGWAPDSCTLPTVDRPLRIAEFDELFAGSVRSVDRVAETTVRLILAGDALDRARDLAERESRCCSFFRFGFTAEPDGVVAMQVSVPAAQTAVLDALALRAAAVAGLDGDPDHD